MDATRSTDKDIGVTLLLGILALVAAAYTFVEADQALTAWGFAATVTLGVLAVAASHVYAE